MLFHVVLNLENSELNRSFQRPYYIQWLLILLKHHPNYHLL
jgi:hypothetical protein